ncbi:TonB family protein [Terriglobus roseus DSM 18391]|uniref:TonB family protein n=1 Tax=Terriglobus roseus (strain DSM 18391 / NRRL B-41598 / KBS 63) TaxID=926566 RepID=I3ZK10_TERRK|nr:TonB family protein [Terriglobus roseus DSM 18391]
MLQPAQLKDVSVRYSHEVAELRDFLGKAGFSLGTAGTLEAVAAALQRDRAFHRDLILHVWVLIDGCGGQISPSDLLGVLAVAAAGMHFAAEASEEDAHDLLRFVMEARRSVDAPTSKRVAEPVPAAVVSAAVPVAAAVDVPAAALPLALDTPRFTPPVAVDEAPSEEVVERGGGKRSAWIVGLALCLLVLVAVGVWQYRENSPAPVEVGTAVDGSAATAVSPSTAEAPTSGNGLESAPVVPTPVGPSMTARGPVVRPSREAAAVDRSVVPSVPPRTSYAPPAQDVAAAPAPVVRSAPPASPVATVTPLTRPAVAAPSTPLVRPGAARPAAPVAVPAGTLSRQLGSSTIPAYAALPDADATTDGKKYPRLLRRRMSLNNNTQVAELRPPGGSGGAGSVPVGVVRPTSLGIMAGNLVYSPTPAYPSAAAAAHVQGEVKVQAEIDRDGNVVSARVVSGPPMLRDAAVDAIQHWRYKPWTAGGKTVPMSAVAVVDFQLP